MGRRYDDDKCDGVGLGAGWRCRQLTNGQNNPSPMCLAFKTEASSTPNFDRAAKRATMSDKRCGIRFIHSHEQETVPWVTSAETRRRLHSHAARATHAKTRRQRMIQQRATTDSHDSSGGGRPSKKAATDVQVTVLPSPIGTLGSGRRDVFASFARRLSPVEDFLLDYCKIRRTPRSSFFC